MAHQVDHVREQVPIAADRSLGELFSQLTEDTTTLVRAELALAKVEMTHKAAEVGKDVGFLAAGGAVLYAGLLALVAALIIGLGQLGVTWWLSAFIVGIVVLAIGGGLVYSGLSALKGMNMAPTQTLETLKEDQEWAKRQKT